jgi:hypothetical protein
MLTLEQFRDRVLKMVREKIKIDDDNEFNSYLKEHGADGYIGSGFFRITCPKIYGEDCGSPVKIETEVFCTADNILWD